MSWWILVFGHGVDEECEEVFLYDDDAYPASLNFIVIFSRIFVHIAFLIAQIFLQRCGCLFGGGFDGDPIRVGCYYFSVWLLARRKLGVPARI